MNVFNIIMTPRGVTKSVLRDKMTNVKHIMLFQNQFKKKTTTLKPNLNFKKEPFQKKYLYNISFSMEHDGRNRFGRENIMYKKFCSRLSIRIEI